MAGILTLMLIAGAFVFGRRPKGGAKGVDVAAERDRLVDKRESTFAELIALERAARDKGASAPPPADRRKQLVAKLEQIYRDIAALDERQPA